VTGINIETDIDQIVACVVPGADHDGGGVVVARGRFNDALLESLARQHGAEIEEYRGKRLMLMRVESGDVTIERKSGALAFLEPGLIAVGDAATIKRAIDAQLTSASITANDEIMDLVADIDSTSNAWAVGRFDALARHANLPEQVSTHMPKLQWFAVTGYVNGGVSGTVRAEATDDKAAEDLRAVINGGLAFARMAGGNDPKVAAMLQSLQLTGSGRTVTLSFTVPAEVFDAIAAARGLQH
jgi:hypothetical protein